MTSTVVKRLQIYVEQASEEALTYEAAERGICTKAEITRQLVHEHLGNTTGRDPLEALVGSFDDEPSLSRR